MKVNILLSIIFGLTIVCGVYLFAYNKQKAETPVTLLTPSDAIFPTVNNIAAKSIISRSGVVYSALPVIEHKQTEVVNNVLYRNTNANDIYNIYYNEEEGLILILLYDEDLARARDMAEAQLTKIFPQTKGELCDMNVSIQTNEHVNKYFSGKNLGLSFCPGSLEL